MKVQLPIYGHLTFFLLLSRQCELAVCPERADGLKPLFLSVARHLNALLVLSADAEMLFIAGLFKMISFSIGFFLILHRLAETSLEASDFIDFMVDCCVIRH